MSQTWRFPLILGLSVVFGAPVLGELAFSPDDLVVAGIRYLGALGLSWLGVTFIYRLMDGFATENHYARQDAEAEAAREMLLAEREAASQPVADGAAHMTTEPAMS